MVSASLPGHRRRPWHRRLPPRLNVAGRIAGINEMTSSSSLGSTRIILEFNFNRDINGAARDVQAAYQCRAEPAAERYAEPSDLP
ncbi:hypothetical protein ACLK2H_11905 [Escherichia coli]